MELVRMEDFLDRLPAEQRRLRERCRNASAAFIPFAEEGLESSIPARFEQIVGLYPDRLATKHGARQMTYRELNQAANVTAHTLLAGSGRAEAVALLFDYGITMLCAVFGVLKAGSWYVPLSPHDPSARLARIVEDAGAGVILTDTANLELAQRTIGSGGIVLNLDELDLSAPAANPGLEIGPDANAYVIYTSGSTGAPKGVLEMQRNVLEYCMSYINDSGVCPTDRMTLLASLSFSGSLMAVFGTLLSGAALLPFDVRASGFKALGEWLNAEAITIFIGGSVFRLLANNSEATLMLPGLRMIYCGAEATFAHDFEWYKAHCADDCVLVVSLGMTEVKSIRRFLVDKSYVPTNPVIPVGYRTRNIDVFIRGEDGQELPVGSIGEITVRSRFISRGYYGRPDLTAEKYLPDPKDPTQRIFLTGDLGRLDTEGCLHHAGRKDAQVKVHGQRVEVTEVEAVLNSLPGVTRAAVLVEEVSPGNMRLVAWVAPLPAPGVDAVTIRHALAVHLPSYMIPEKIGFLPELPMLVSSKIDRQALRRQPLPVEPVREVALAQPQDELERRLLALWREMLGYQQIGVDQSFFDLGGNSLLAARLIVRLEEESGDLISLAAFLQAPTIVALAELIRAGAWNSPWRSLVPLQADGGLPALYLVPPEASTTEPRFVRLAKLLGPGQPVYGFNPLGIDGVTPPQDSVAAMAGYYLSEFRALQPAGPYLVGGMCFGATVAYEMAQQLAREGQEVPLLIILDGAPPVRAEAGVTTPTMRLTQLQERLRHRLQAASLPAVVADEIGLRLMRTQRVVRRQWSRRNAIGALTEHIRAAHQRARRSYRALPYSGRVVVYESEQRARDGRTDDWRLLTVGTLATHVIPGTSHQELLSSEHGVQAVAAHLHTLLTDRRPVAAPPTDRTNGGSAEPSTVQVSLHTA